ncbi:MAG: FAD binding domain-containing protein, partial [Deltaproteobacteria bacterium]|nr:FAD binding domain-containing protein [Deltaproteobacteria bacterium]
MRPFKLLDPRSLDEACQMLDRYGEDVKLMSGGTAILILLRQRVFSKPYFINLKAVPGLDGIRDEPGTGLRIGALATLRAVETSPIVRQRAPLITETFRLVANVRVRNSGTLGGNL